MPTPNTTDPAPTAIAAVTIRIPCGADGALIADAEERLSRIDHVDAITIDELHSIDPKLSATVITVEITIRWISPMTAEKISEQLTEAPGL